MENQDLESSLRICHNFSTSKIFINEPLEKKMATKAVTPTQNDTGMNCHESPKDKRPTSNGYTYSIQYSEYFNFYYEEPLQLHLDAANPTPLPHTGLSLKQ